MLQNIIPSLILRKYKRKNTCSLNYKDLGESFSFKTNIIIKLEKVLILWNNNWKVKILSLKKKITPVMFQMFKIKQSSSEIETKPSKSSEVNTRNRESFQN